jgi:hypothetical protein
MSEDAGTTTASAPEVSDSTSGDNLGYDASSGNSDVNTEAEAAYDAANAEMLAAPEEDDAGFDMVTGELEDRTETDETGEADETSDEADDPEAEAEGEVEDEAEAEVESDEDDYIELTEEQEMVLDMLGLEPEDIEGWSPERLDDLVDRMLDQAEALEESGVDTDEGDFDYSDDPMVEAFDTAADELISQMVEEYGEEIRPMGDMFKAIARDASQSRQAVVETSELMIDVATMQAEMALENLIPGFEKEFPSIAKPGVREKVTERFWSNWETGQYMQPGAMFAGVREALNDAVSATFGGQTTEANAAASLVEKNRRLVQNQPKPGPQKPPRAKPMSEDERVESVYDDGVAELLKG